jgi:hypothetical protein
MHFQKLEKILLIDNYIIKDSFKSANLADFDSIECLKYNFIMNELYYFCHVKKTDTYKIQGSRKLIDGCHKIEINFSSLKEKSCGSSLKKYFKILSIFFSEFFKP